MEDKVIVSVCARPILYDTTMVSYRDRNKKDLAWVEVGEETGLPGKFSEGLFCLSSAIGFVYCETNLR